MMDVEIRNGSGYSYFAAIEEGEEMGEAVYHTSSDGRMTITHVGIEPRYRGAGRAEALMRKVVEYARENNLKIVPICPFARAMFQRYPDLRDVLAELILRQQDRGDNHIWLPPLSCYGYRHSARRGICPCRHCERRL